MKRIAWLLSFSLILLGAVQGVAAGQQLSGRSDGNYDPLDKVENPKAKEKLDKAKEKLDKAKEKVDKAKEKVDKAKEKVNESPSDETSVDDVTDEVEKPADNMVKDSSEVAEDSGSSKESAADESTQSGTDISAPGASASKTKLNRSTHQSGTASWDASGAESSDTDKVSAAGNTIESAPENDEQPAAPEADADESEGSVLSSTGAQILAWVVLAFLLIAMGVSLVGGDELNRASRL